MYTQKVRHVSKLLQMRESAQLNRFFFLKDDIYKLNTIESEILNILCHVLFYLEIV